MSQQLENKDLYSRINHTKKVFVAVVEWANVGKPNKATAARILEYINTPYLEEGQLLPSTLVERIIDKTVTPYDRRSVNRMVYAVGMAGGNTVASRGVAYPPKGIKYGHIKERYIKGIMQGMTAVEIDEFDELNNPKHVPTIEVSEDYQYEEHELYV